jgi:hypothetical protein
MPVQGSDAALNQFWITSFDAGRVSVIGLLHVAGMTRLTWHIRSITNPGVLPLICEPLVGYRTRTSSIGDGAFTEPAGTGMKRILPPALVAGGLAMFNANTVAAEVMGCRIFNVDPAASITATIVFSASA